MVKLQVASDLHTEFNKCDNYLDLITPSADILILAGDIGSLYEYENLKNLLKKICEGFNTVIYVPGNHEFYYRKGHAPLSMKDLRHRLNMLGESIKNLYILDKGAVEIDGVCIAGVTLWSNPKVKLPSYIVQIKGVGNFEYANMFNSDVEYVKNVIEYCKQKELRLVVVSHHCPSYSLLEGCDKNPKFESLYASDLDYLLDGDSIHTWIFGHNHKNFDIKSEKGTRLVSNQKGKPKDRINNFSKNFCIKV